MVYVDSIMDCCLYWQLLPALLNIFRSASAFFSSVADPQCFYADPDTDPDPVDPDPGWPKIYSWKKIFFWQKIAIYFSLGLHKGCLSSSSSLHPSKENIWHLKTWNFFTFVGNYGPPDQIECGSVRNRIRIRNTALVHLLTGLIGPSEFCSRAFGPLAEENSFTSSQTQLPSHPVPSLPSHSQYRGRVS